MLFGQIVSDLILHISGEHKRGTFIYEDNLLAIPGQGGKVRF